MAKRRKKYPSKKSSDPINSMINLAGAVAMGAYTRRKIKQAYEKGEGDAAIAAAMMIHGAKTIKHGNDSMIALGGLYGLNSALKDVGKTGACRQPIGKRR